MSIDKPITRIKKTDEISKYYDELIKKITNDWQNKLYQKAIDRLNEELDQPYIPFEYEDLMQDMLYSYQRELRFINLDQKYQQMNMHDLMVNIFKNNKFDIFLFDLFIQKYGEKISDLELNTIQIWLKDKNIDCSDKFLILDSLAELNIDHNFVFYNQNVDNDAILNPLNYHNHELLEKYNSAFYLLKQMTYKDLSLANFCNDLLNACVNYYFPEFPFSSVKNLVDSITFLISSFINMDEIDVSKLNYDQKILYKLVEKISDEDNNNY